MGLLLASAFTATANAQGATGTNPPPGSIWTYLGPTFGAGWAPAPVGQFIIPQCVAGPADQSGCIQQAATNVCANGGGILLLPAGAWHVHDVIFRCPVNVVGYGLGATTVDYSASASGFAFMWEPGGFPAVKQSQFLMGSGIRDVGLVRTAGNNTGLVVHGVQNFVAENLRFNTPYNGVDTIGVQNPRFFHIDMEGTINTDFNFHGDLTGLQSNGSACAVGNADCSTRSDFINLGALYLVDNTATNTCINIQGFVDTVSSIGPIACEGPNIGLKSTCPAGLDPALSQCPHFIFLDNFQTEFFKTYGIFLQDTINVKMSKAYSYGVDSAATVNALYISTLNYGSTTGCSGAQCQSPGGIRFDNGLFFATQNDCLLVQAAANTLITDVAVNNSSMNGCNSSNAGYGAISIAPSGGAVTQGHFTGNALCAYSGYSASALEAYGIKYGTNATNFVSGNNTVFQCTVPIINTSFTNYDFGSNPPPVFGTITETDGHIGSTGTIAPTSANAVGGTLRITPGGTGISSSGQFTMSLPANVTMQPGMICIVSPATNWGNGATIQGVNSNPTSIIIAWNNIQNGALTNLTSGTPYNMNFKCTGF